MIVEKELLCTLDSCYAVSYHKFQDKDYIIAASEEKAGCFVIDLETREKFEVWNNIGGTMTIVPIEDNDTFQFFATRKFYPGFQAKEAELVHVAFINNEFIISKVTDFPYLHRFDFFEDHGELHFIGCTLCKNKESVEDWSSKGSIWSGVYSYDQGKIVDLNLIYDGITKNHGFVKRKRNTYYVTGEEGIFEVQYVQGWTSKLIFPIATSEVAFLPTDEESVLMSTIEPFHGNVLRVYKNMQLIYEYNSDFLFGHVNTHIRLFDKDYLIIGCRQGSKDLQLLSYEDDSFHLTNIDHGKGPANIAVHCDKNEIVAANGGTNEITIYKFKEERK